MTSMFFICIFNTVLSLAKGTVDPLLDGSKLSWWTLNRITCCMSACLFGALNISWFWAAKKEGIHGERIQKIVRTAGRNWYSSVFATPLFLRPPAGQ